MVGVTHLPSMQTLRAFEAAGRLASYSRAAEELGVTHGAISHRIRELELRMGRKLFKRMGNQMQLTPTGRELLASVRNGLRLLERAFGSESPSARQLVVSVLPVLASCWLVPRLGTFRRLHPEKAIELNVTTELVRFADDGVDVAIRYGLGGWPDVECRLLGTDVIYPVCSPKYARELNIREPRDLARCVLLRTPWQPWSRWFDAAGLEWSEPSDGPAYPDSSLLVRAATAGEGVALSRNLLIVDEIERGNLCRLFETEVTDINSYFLVWPLTTKQKDEILQLGDWLTEEMRLSGTVEIA